MNVHYFKLLFTGFTTGESKGLHYIRLIADGYVFYTDKRYFQDCSLFARLKKGETIYLGAHKLKDGTFWIHWITDGVVMLEPNLSARHYRSPLLKSLFSIVIFAISGLSVLHLDWPIIITIIILFFSFGLFCFQLAKLFQCIALKRHRGMQDLIEKMELAKHGEYGYCQQPDKTRYKRESSQFLTSENTSLPTRYAIAHGEVQHPEFSTWTSGSGKYRRNFHGLKFQCAEHMLSLKWQVADIIVSTHPIFKRQCPPFLTENDNVAAVYQRHSNQIDVLYNITDGRIYLKRNGFCITNRMKHALYKFLYLYLPCLFLAACTVFYFFDIESLSQWDWWKYSDSMLDAIILTFWCSNIILGVVEVCSFILRHFSSHVSDWLELSKVLQQTNITAENIVEIQELS